MENADARASVGAKQSRAASLREALAISGNGQAVLWPRSVDWKLRHARAHLAVTASGIQGATGTGGPDSAEAILLGAMELLEEDTRLNAGAGEAVRLRHQIFSMLDSARTRR
jgi:hypothetical protein